MNGVLLIDKPKGFTSFDVIAVIRRLTGQRKTGHTGTLDPNATGVLPVLLGCATKAQDIIPNHDKEYAASFKLGMTTDTLDIWGQVKSRRQSRVTKSDLLRVIPEFTGEITQVPPMYSAVKKDGQRLYDLARQGIEVERGARVVTVYELELLDFDEANQEGRLRVLCSKGTYVRTLIDDMGKLLGTGAVMTALRRTSACGFSLEQCVTLEQLERLAENGEALGVLRPVESLFEAYPPVCVSNAQAKRFSNGGALDITRTGLRGQADRDGKLFRVKNPEGGFLGLGKAEDGMLKIYKLFLNT
ncbi:MAG TPA: tRNA pseudouridine(55) synthase TruB [Ruminococcaceae bacterium]|nr:tRNA pseudouridine(55) synthase TruB [Oscillospiraceae bacterium]